MTNKEIGTQEWYDFIGNLSRVLPGLHLGGSKATEDLLKACQINEQSYVLDVGCGPGNTSCIIAKTYNSRVMGIDISENMVKEAKKRAKKEGVSDKVAFRVADVLQLPFDDHEFDVAIFESVLTPLPDKKINALHEVIRVLRPNGFVGINESVIDFEPTPEIIQLLEKHPAINDYFTTPRLRRLVEDSGLKIISIGEYKETSSMGLKDLGIRNLMTFMILSYPKVVWKLITDGRFRRAQKIDDEINKHLRNHGGYILLVGQKSN